MLYAWKQTVRTLLRDPTRNALPEEVQAFQMLICEATMRAALLDRSRLKTAEALRIHEVPVPQVSEGHLLLKILACGVCRTDLHILEGELPPILPALIPGHQIVGEIVGGATANFKVGQRVGVSWLGGTDGSCVYCRRGLENLCDAPTFTG